MLLWPLIKKNNKTTLSDITLENNSQSNYGYISWQSLKRLENVLKHLKAGGFLFQWKNSSRKWLKLQKYTLTNRLNIRFL